MSPSSYRNYRYGNNLFHELLYTCAGLWGTLFMGCVLGISLLSGSKPTPLAVLGAMALIIGSVCVQVYFWYMEGRYAAVATIVALLVALACAVGSYHYLADKKGWEGLITNKRWRYEWDVSQWSKTAGKCWGLGCAPTDAYNEKSQWEDTGRRRKVGETCTTQRQRQSDGTYREYQDCTDITVSVYEWRVYYTVNAWVKARTEVATGGAETPYWPDLHIVRQFEEPGCDSQTE